MSFFSFKKKPALSFVFDIRDSSIALAVARIEACEKPELVFCHNFQIKIQDTSDHQKYLSSMLATFDHAVLSARKTLIKTGNAEKIEKHFFFVGSPWSVSQSKMIKVAKDRPFEVNNSFLKKIITDEETRDENEMAQISGEGDWRVLEEKVIRTKLNGYAIEKIFGKKTADFEAELFVSFIPHEVQNKINSFADIKLKNGTFRHAGSPILSSYSYLRDAYPEKSDFIYLDMGNYLTDVYIVKDNIIFAIASFPSGEKEILKSAAKSAKTSEHLVSSAANILRDNNYDAAEKKKFKDSINPGIEAWSAKLSDLLSKICKNSNIPRDLFIVPKSEFSEFIIGNLSKKENGLKIRIVEEQSMSDQITNGKMFLNEQYVKMDMIFLAKNMR